MKTKTYAEILAGQGEYAQAASIYRHLLKAAAGDGALRARLSELEHLAATSPPPERLREEPEPRPAPPPPRPAPPPRTSRPVTAPRLQTPAQAARREVLLGLLDRIVRRRQRT